MTKIYISHHMSCCTHFSELTRLLLFLGGCKIRHPDKRTHQNIIYAKSGKEGSDMKQTKKFMSLLLAFVMVLSLTNGLTVKAAEAATSTITVTLRVEQDEATMVPPTKVTLTEEDLTKDYGISLPTGKLTTMTAVAKYLETYAGAKDETMGNFLLYSKGNIQAISLEGKLGEKGASDGTSPNGNAGCYWMYKVNNTDYTNAETGYSYNMDQYELKDNDVITVYSLWYSEEEETNYTYFNDVNYEVEAGKELAVQLKGLGFDSSWNTVEKEISGATIIASEYDKDKSFSATEENSKISKAVDEKGNAILTFDKSGTYVLSAYRKATDGKHNTISRPYAIVTVTDPKKDETQTDAKTDNTTADNTKTNATTTDNSASATTEVKKPSKVKNLKASVAKKFKKKKKSVKLTWKKVSNAKGYQVYISKKKKSGYKKTATVIKAKTTLKLKKGTYYVKVRAYNKSGSATKKGAFSSPVKVKIKK